MKDSRVVPGRLHGSTGCLRGVLSPGATTHAVAVLLSRATMVCLPPLLYGWSVIRKQVS